MLFGVKINQILIRGVDNAILRVQAKRNLCSILYILDCGWHFRNPNVAVMKHLLLFVIQELYAFKAKAIVFRIQFTTSVAFPR